MTIVDRSDWTTKARTLHAQAFSLAEEAVSEAREILAQRTPADEEHLALACALLFRRVITGVEAIILLIERGFCIEARIQSRSVLEALCRLGALCRDPQLLEQYYAQGFLARIRMAKDLLQLRETVKDAMTGTEPTVEQVEAIIAEAQEKIDAVNLKRDKKDKVSHEMQSHEWAKSGGMLQHFWAQYAGLSQSVHHSLQDLEWHLEFEDGNRKQPASGFHVGPDQRPPSRPVLIDTIFSLYTAAKEYSTLRKIEMSWRLTEVFEASVKIARAEF